MSIISSSIRDSHTNLEEKIKSTTRRLRKIVSSILISSLLINTSPNVSRNFSKKNKSIFFDKQRVINSIHDSNYYPNQFLETDNILKVYTIQKGVKRKRPVMKEEFKNLKPKKIDSQRIEIPVLMYHGIGNDKYSITPKKFRLQLEKLKENNFYFISLQEFIDEDYSRVPAGKRPILLTFDDSLKSQVNGFLINGKFVPYFNCAVEILEYFFKSNPDVGKGGVFFVNSQPFGSSFRKEKIIYLINNGYDIEYHTRFHVNLRKKTPEYVDKDLKKFEEEIRSYIPNYHSKAIAFPFGADPKKEVADLIKKRFLASFDAEYYQPVRNSLYDVPRIEMSNRKGEENNLQTFIFNKEFQYFKKSSMIFCKKNERENNNLKEKKSYNCSNLKQQIQAVYFSQLRLY